MSKLYRFFLVSVFSLIIILFISRLAFLIYRNYKDKSIKNSTPNEKILENEIVIGVGNIFKKLFKDYEVTPSYSPYEQYSLLWIGEDGYMINIGGGVESIVLRVPSILTASDWDEKVSSTLDIIAPQIDEYLYKRGFTENAINTLDLENPYFTYIKSFEKDDMKCSLMSNASFVPTESIEESKNISIYDGYLPIYFICSSSFDYYHEVQIPFLKALIDDDLKRNIEYKSSYATSVHRYPDHKDFATLKVNGYGAGHFAIVKNISDKWTVIYRGNAVPFCETLIKYSVPKEVFNDCALEDGKVIENPN